MSYSDWAFDVRDHFQSNYADRLGFIPDEEQRYPDRITGTLVSGTTQHPKEERFVVYPKPVGSDNAARYRRWVTLPPVHWENMTNRPAGWRVFILMVGLLPDGGPWWSALYDEQVLAQQRDLSQQMSGGGYSGKFYRFDPALTDPALVADWDVQRGTGYPASGTQVVYRLDLPGKSTYVTKDAGEFVASLWDYARGYGAAGEGPEDPVTGRIDVGDRTMAVHFSE